MGPPHPGAGPAESPYLVNGGDPLPRAREAVGTAAVPAGPGDSQFISLTAEAQHSAPLSLTLANPRRPLPALFPSPSSPPLSPASARRCLFFCPDSPCCMPSISCRPRTWHLLFPVSNLLSSPANAAKLEVARLDWNRYRERPFPIARKPLNVIYTLRREATALPHCRTTACGISDRSGDTDAFSLLPCLPALPAYRPAQQTRSAHSVSDTIPPDLGRCARISPSPLPPSANQPRVPTGLCLDRCLSVGCCSEPSPSLVCPVSPPDSHPILAPDNRPIHHRPVSRAPWSAGPG